MKLLLDEHLSPLVAQLLRERGFDVEAVSERSDLVSVSDRVLMEVAAAESRAVATNNVTDFRPIGASLLANGKGHGGLILLPARPTRTRHATGYLTDAIAAIMADYPGGIVDSQHWVAPPSP